MRVESSTSTNTGNGADAGRHAPRGRWPAAAGLLLLLAGCRGEMYDQPREDTYDASAFFDDGKSARPLVPGTVANVRFGGPRRNRLFIAADTTLYSLMMSVTGTPALPLGR